MKIIEMLDKMATGEISTKAKVKYGNARYERKSWESLDYYIYKELGKRSEIEFIDFLNDEIEIIEENKKIEKIDTQYYDDERYTPETRLNICMNYINKLIDEVNKLKGEK